MPMPDPGRIRAKCEQDGIEEVKNKLLRKAYASHKIPIVEDWLSEMEKKNDTLEPKPPEFVQKIKWLLLYGRKHWKILLLCVVILAVTFLVKVFYKEYLVPTEVSSTEIIITPETPNIRAEPQMSGSLTKNANIATAVVRIGDNGNNEEVRGFVCFNLSKVQTDREIISAKLTLSVQPHEPNKNIGGLDIHYFHAIVIESVDIMQGASQGLDIEDFDRSGNLIKNTSMKDILSKSYEVKDDIIKWINDGRVIITFRLRFTVETNNDGRPDALTMNLASDNTKLVIKYGD